MIFFVAELATMAGSLWYCAARWPGVTYVPEPGCGEVFAEKVPERFSDATGPLRRAAIKSLPLVSTLRADVSANTPEYLSSSSIPLSSAKLTPRYSNTCWSWVDSPSISRAIFWARFNLSW